MTKMFQMNIHIPQELNDELVRFAQEEGITRSEFVRRTLWDRVNTQKKGVSECETAYDSMTVDLRMESRIEELEKRMDEKESKGWIRRKLRI